MVVVAPERPLTIEVEPDQIEPVEPKTSEIGDTLRQAAIEIVNRGWCKYVLMDVGGKVCMLGAMRAATGSPLSPPKLGSAADPRYVEVRNYVEGHLRDGSISYYNDRPGRTRKQVLDKLKALADLADTECV